MCYNVITVKDKEKSVKTRMEKIMADCYHHTAMCEDGKLYEFYCKKFPNGSYDLTTMRRIIVTDKKYIEWYKHNHRKGR